MKQNPTSDFQRCTMSIQCQCPMLKQRQNNLRNVDTTLYQRCARLSRLCVASMLSQRRALTLYRRCTTLFQRSVDISESYIESNRASDDYGFVNRWIVFILLNEKMFFTHILTIKLPIKYRKNFLAMVHIVIRNGGNNGDIHRSWKYCIQNFKTSLKNMKT